ncbi:MAG: chemotaxis protein CheW [Symploca sp. SIO3C6]|nr:chemotaxis protein CheW [Symploca sp. SIO3C6]
MQINPDPPQPIQQYLSFHLTLEHQAMLPTRQLSEVFNLDSTQIVPITDMLAAVMGICNHRGEALWLVDLAYLLGLTPLFTQNWRNLNPIKIIVIRECNKLLGLAVYQVDQLSLYNLRSFQSMPVNDYPQSMAFCLQGYNLTPDGKTTIVLDGKAIFDFLSQLQS